MSLLERALVLGAIGFAAGLFGTVAGAAARESSNTVTSYVQHFTVGLIIATAALDLLPEARHIGGDRALMVGFALGIGFMVTLRSTTQWFGHGRHGGNAHGADRANLPLIADVMTWRGVRVQHQLGAV